jgi:hypothetical protein
MGKIARTSAMRAALAALLAALAGCPTVDLGDAPPDPGQCRPDPAYFEQTLWSNYLVTANPATSCASQAGCHRREDGRSALRLELPADGEPVDFDTNYAVVTRFLNCGTPDASPLYTKPVSGVNSHGGGDLFAPGSASASVFLDWFAQ